MLNFIFVIFERIISLTSPENIRVFMSISINNKSVGKMKFELFTKDAPLTVANFKALIEGNMIYLKNENQIKLSYKNSTIHRIIPGFVVQGGDFTHGNGYGGHSIYGDNFMDEKFIHKHQTRGMLSMANRGQNTNSSQFFITLGNHGHLDGRHVVFGKLYDGWDVLNKIESCGSQGGKVSDIVRIEDCGVVSDENNGEEEL